MRVALLTREYPPNVYGGAGVHVEHLSAELDHIVDLDVHCFGPRRRRAGESPRVIAHPQWKLLEGDGVHRGALAAASVDLSMVAALEGVEVVHSHTWYTNLAGELARLTYAVPHVATVHSLEPLRPWKEEQLGGGYRVSSFCERVGLEGADALIAVSEAVAADLRRCYPSIRPERIHVIANGVAPTAFRAARRPAVLRAHGIDPRRPYVLFVGRISRQKGIGHFLAAGMQLDHAVQVVIRAGAPDTLELADEVAEAVAKARGGGHDVVWGAEDLPRRSLVALIAGATVLCSPSVYEPFGLVNAEAMACGVPVVASAVGGIPEVVEDKVTGLLVPFEPADDNEAEPQDPDRFAADLAAAMRTFVADPVLAQEMGAAGRRRALERFSWAAAARQTADIYGLITGAR